MQLNITPIDHALRGQLEHRLVSKHNMSSVTANAALDDMLGYLHTIAHNPGTGLGPSEIVDVAWHEFILHTADYMAYCEQVFGRYIHHRPNRQGEVGRPIADTAKFMAEHGIVYDPQLWTGKHECDNKCDPNPGGPNCDSGRIGDPTLVFADQLGHVMTKCTVDCDGGNGGGPSGCGSGGGGGCS